MRVFGWAVLGVLAVAAIVLGGWWVGWWFKEQNIEKESHIVRKSYANQERLREDAAEKAGEVSKIEVEIAEVGSEDPELVAKLEAQAERINEMACHDIGQLTEMSPEAEEFKSTHCVGIGG